MRGKHVKSSLFSFIPIILLYQIWMGIVYFKKNVNALKRKYLSLGLNLFYESENMS